MSPPAAMFTEPLASMDAVQLKRDCGFKNVSVTGISQALEEMAHK
jgi:hypothetical protein